MLSQSYTHVIRLVMPKIRMMLILRLRISAPNLQGFPSQRSQWYSIRTTSRILSQAGTPLLECPQHFDAYHVPASAAAGPATDPMEPPS